LRETARQKVWGTSGAPHLYQLLAAEDANY
jgi:hypothetical protein